jgi:hypothetical protein
MGPSTVGLTKGERAIQKRQEIIHIQPRLSASANEIIKNNVNKFSK